MNQKDALKEIQKILKTAGLYGGAIDGQIGWISYSAVLDLKEKTKQFKKQAREIQGILAEQRVYFGAIDGDFGGGSMSGFNSLLPAPQLTDEMLKRLHSKAVSGFAVMINAAVATYHVKTKADLCGFLANVLHESSGFSELRENMNYRAERLLKVFPKYFKTAQSAQAIAARGPAAIANTVYGGRMGNSKDNDDGFNYRGGGPMHLTGRDNYKLCSIGIGAGDTLLKSPELIVKPEYSVKSALWFWSRNSCSGAVNKGDFNQSCVIVNGGKNGLEERQALFKKAWSVLP
ncbi:glycoside hydrolase family 19 protein [Acinetobacter sp. ANC 3813]|uniref:glycoside hydrolase family 19 protein n=1 Tax=Acinetobacter sp. ANC 3813 TaxID=1977873 RepID=UPI000A353D9F|nr:glycoside hydrolase family 19 protein [Acinetobacter sp. ANC 3813]OTG87862.1 hypothetical protein B9T34_16125 [Acinetobacter sp. ANC 3813]